MSSIRNSRVCVGLTLLGLLTFVSPVSAAIFTIDDFEITRVNGNLVFQDTFSDGLPPPSAPNFANGNPGSYSVRGVAGPEAGGKLSLNTALGAPTDAVSRPGENSVIDARLLTNIDPLNMRNGFKVGNDFIVSGLFDLSVLPTVPREGFGIRLSDGGLSPVSNDIVDIMVRRNAGGALVVDFRRVDVSADFVTIIDSIMLELGHQQILLELSKLDAGTKTITASFAYVDGGVAGSDFVFANTADIFNGENVTRASFRAQTPIPISPTLYLSLIGLAGMAWVRRPQ